MLSSIVFTYTVHEEHSSATPRMSPQGGAEIRHHIVIIGIMY